MDQTIIRDITLKFEELFSTTPITIRSPGRINLIGEHTDYNLGFVLPAAIDKEIYFCISPNRRDNCRLFSWDMQESYSFNLDNLIKSPLHWANYIIGMVEQMQKRGYEIGGFDCVFGGDIPIGAGLSSSAALGCGIGFCLNETWKLDLSKLEIAQMAQRAEIEFAGLNCGLMDQYANMFGEPGNLLQLDCRSLTHKSIHADFKDYHIVLFNSGVKHELGDTAYNQRRQECESGVRMISKYFPEVKSLRDCSRQMLTKIALPEHSVIHQRCEYVIEENERVLEGCEDLTNGRLLAFGEKLYQSHEGLSKKYQVSCRELDILVDLTGEERSIIGARMMGGGFGGCTINLVHSETLGEVSARIHARYLDLTGKELPMHQVSIAGGTSLLDTNL